MEKEKCRFSGKTEKEWGIRRKEVEQNYEISQEESLFTECQNNYPVSKGVTIQFMKFFI